MGAPSAADPRNVFVVIVIAGDSIDCARIWAVSLSCCSDVAIELKRRPRKVSAARRKAGCLPSFAVRGSGTGVEEVEPLDWFGGRAGACTLSICKRSRHAPRRS